MVWDLLAQRVLQDLPGRLDQLDLPGRPALTEPLGGLWDLQAQLDRRELPELPGPPAQLELQAPLALQDPLDLLDRPGLQDLLDQRDPLELPGRLLEPAWPARAATTLAVGRLYGLSWGPRSRCRPESVIWW